MTWISADGGAQPYLGITGEPRGIFYLQRTTWEGAELYAQLGYFYGKGEWPAGRAYLGRLSCRSSSTGEKDPDVRSLNQEQNCGQRVKIQRMGFGPASWMQIWLPSLTRKED